MQKEVTIKEFNSFREFQAMMKWVLQARVKIKKTMLVIMRTK